MRTTFKACTRTYGVLLILYPRELRFRFAEEMTDVFEQQVQEAWNDGGLTGLVGVWLCALRELLCVALPARLGQPVIVAPALSLIGNSAMFLALLRELSPLADLCRAYRH